MNRQSTYANAKKRVEERIRFYVHLAVYLAVATFLIILNLAVTGGYLWAIWPILGWGSGLIVHGLRTFVTSSESSYKERLIEKEMQKGI